ncbi:MAG: cytochrome c-type biogenesis protein CcmH [Gammaproteobacteria bacterium]|nr:cytochrome c-type biogenesis protein CcmH [Gammaproteobacteria bacterium]MDH3362994.1 cytochrome c-type biogenesis protein CcmH [Gammaproteobacteria bacterium]
MRRLLMLAVAMLASAPVAAIDSSQAFDDPVLQARYEKLISEVRCLKCQNQSIKDSNVFLAADLRREIRRLISEGKTDTEIADFLVTRYGEFALYRPRTTGKTLILWIAPFLLVLFGGFAMFRVIRHRMTLPLDDSGVAEGSSE